MEIKKNGLPAVVVSVSVLLFHKIDWNKIKFDWFE